MPLAQQELEQVQRGEPLRQGRQHNGAQEPLERLPAAGSHGMHPVSSVILLLRPAPALAVLLAMDMLHQHEEQEQQVEQEEQVEVEEGQGLLGQEAQQPLGAAWAAPARRPMTTLCLPAPLQASLCLLL